jgi:tetratricopeptide (TPR) repeat protein
MLGRQMNLDSDAAAAVAVAVELADLQVNRFGRPEAAASVLESVLQRAPDDVRILSPLADAYFLSGRVEAAAPLYERLAEEAKKGRRMKDLARFKQRIGGIYEAAGDLDAARAAYEEAFRVDPTNVATMAGLGRLYIDQQKWDKARRVYRSMVLQNLDPEVGISKAEVYYNLGYIHVQMDEPKKARSMFQRGLELEPNNPQLRAGLESVADS